MSDSIRSKAPPAIVAALVVTLAAASAIAYHAGLRIPLAVSLLLFAAATAAIAIAYQRKSIGPLSLLYYALYCAPFIHIPPYLFFDFNSDPLIMWGLVANDYMKSAPIIELTSTIGAVGALGIAMGYAVVSRGKLGKGAPDAANRNRGQSIGMLSWLILTIVGFVLGSYSAAPETIFAEQYAASQSTLAEANFGSAWMVSYVILTFAFCDAQFENRKDFRLIKRSIVTTAVLIVVVYYQLLRGDRESLSWVLGLLLAVTIWAPSNARVGKNTVQWAKIVGATMLIAVISIVVGAIRSSAEGYNISDIIALLTDLQASEALSISNLLHGTWSAVLLTPLSVAGDHVNGELALGLGRDYLNIALSLPPGFVADAVGYIRPLDAGRGPAWEMTYGLGGTHAAVLPFMNFRMIGVFLVSALWAAGVASLERFASGRKTVVRNAALVTATLAAPHFLWYGEKYAVNAIILWILLSIAHQILLSLRFRANGILFEREAC